MENSKTLVLIAVVAGLIGGVAGGLAHSWLVMNVVFCAITGFAWVWLRQHDVLQAIGGGAIAAVFAGFVTHLLLPLK